VINRLMLGTGQNLYTRHPRRPIRKDPMPKSDKMRSYQIINKNIAAKVEIIDSLKLLMR